MSNLLANCPTLKQMLDSRTALTPDNQPLALTSNIPQSFAEALYETVLKCQPSTAIEIGMAFGISSLAILTALRDGEHAGKLITIDPHQSTHWSNCGRAAVERAGLGGQHQIIEAFDYLALPRLLESSLKIDFAYIDGWHTFDYALLDWWYIDKMLSVDGIVAFNDCGFPAVEKVIQFVLTHRSYTELDVGLHPAVKNGRRTEDRYFKKTAATEPAWNFFSPF